MSTIKAANIQNPSAASAAIVLDTSGNFSVPAGTAAAPGIQAPSDSNTGIFFPAADTIAFAEGGSEAMRIDSSSRLLVGTSSGALNNARAVFRGNPLGASETVLELSRGTTVTAVSDGLGSIIFTDSSSNRGAAIIAESEGSWTSGSNHRSRLVFSTTADGASSPTERARITNTGFLKASSTGSYRGSASQYHELRSARNDEFVLMLTHDGTSGYQYGLSVETTNDQNNSGIWFLQCKGSTTSRAEIRTNGGIANYSANNVNLSDINTKKNINPAANTWDCIKEWEIVNFHYKDQPDDADLNLGVIAQQVAESCPEVITVFQEATEDQPEKLGVKEQQMYWMAIKALQEAQVRIEALEAEVTALKAQ